nr:hypothetical protein [Tanacetum cinerariifolium]
MERVWRCRGSSWSSGGVVRMEQEVVAGYEYVAMNIDTSTSSCCHHQEYLQGFAAVLAVIITGASQSRQHGVSEPVRQSLTD